MGPEFAMHGDFLPLSLTGMYVRLVTIFSALFYVLFLQIRRTDIMIVIVVDCIFFSLFPSTLEWIGASKSIPEHKGGGGSGRLSPWWPQDDPPRRAKCAKC